MSKDPFSQIPNLTYAGPDSRDPYTFKDYNPSEEVEGKKMADHLRFACAYWHTMVNPLADVFGGGTALCPWDDPKASPLDMATNRARVFFRFL